MRTAGAPGQSAKRTAHAGGNFNLADLQTGGINLPDMVKVRRKIACTSGKQARVESVAGGDNRQQIPGSYCQVTLFTGAVSCSAI